MDQSALISDTRAGVAGVLSLVEQAQARAAALKQQYDKLGGSDFLDGFSWAEMDITEQEFVDAVGSLGTAFPDLLGAHGTNLYKLKS